MKRKITYAIVILAGLQLMAGCRKYLDISPQERVLLDNYYKTPAEANAAVISIYDRFGFQSGGLYDKVAIMDVASDDQFTGGGGPSDINDLQVVNNFTLNSTTGPQSYLWNKGYAGIFRANVLLSKIDGITMDATVKARYTGEAKALRAIFYFDLVRFFKNIPLLTSAVDPKEIYNVLQVAPADVYALIEKDLVEAIPGLPNTVVARTEGGRLTKGAAQAVLGKVYLQQGKNAQAAEQFALVNGTSPGQINPVYGYKLLTNYSDLFKVANKFNSESILEIVHSNASNGGWGDAGASEGNLLNIIVGPRGYKPGPGAPDYYSGYSFLLFTKEFFDFIHFDPRNKPTVANLDSLEKNGIATYEKGYQNTGYFLEKTIGRVADKAPTGQTELNFPQDSYEIRLADTYLLEAEALLNSNAAVGPGSRAYLLFNAVRARVGLNPVPVTMDNIMKERRLELAGEGHRFLDLVRWGKASTVLAYKGFKAGRNEIFPIPQGELSNTKIEQNKEYGGTK
ncbi:RagB/SusD family nutrient uptake outer membrane protein [Pedobacter mucosus]|uniref:RagB/SusD family nutrient uptake outer membrane protein n=1 Tax=Pedobacter mucosus TaxID=2895286 RepID=UPI001EE4E1E6|nr:RagB/SusD family nutrient uptake outer membrane protein [Pedobacter mucosus]UKT62961.1 RagB/SusD family nutrient uptake outer membrane protein [Pedobacter mucosus]